LVCIVNSSKPPSSDSNREKKKISSGKKAGCQPVHKGVTLEKFDTPDVIKTISVNRDSLTDGDYSVFGFEPRQVVDLDISRLVTEYRAEILQDRNGKKFVAPFPEHVTKAVQ
jgi:transposase